MGDEPYTRQQTTSSRSYGRSTSPHQAAYAVERAKMLFGSYRRGDANDPDTYVASIAAVLSRHDPDLIREVTDPNTGIQATEKYMTFMPNAGELKVYCDAQAARRARLGELGAITYRPQAYLPPPEPEAGDKATVFVPSGNPRYPSLVELAKTADTRLFKYEAGRAGIWVAFGIWDQRQTVAPRRAPDALPLTLSDAARDVMRHVDEVKAMNGEAAE